MPVVATDLFGWGVTYALHARACVERGRVWQAEHYVGAVRDLALTLACLHHGLSAWEARGYDDLPTDVLAHFDPAHVTAPKSDELRAALVWSVRALVHFGAVSGLPDADTVGRRLTELG